MSKFSKNKKARNELKQSFLLSFFSNEDKYATQDVNGFILVKSFNSDSGKWQVSIYTKESYMISQQHFKQSKLFK